MPKSPYARFGKTADQQPSQHQHTVRAGETLPEVAATAPLNISIRLKTFGRRGRVMELMAPSTAAIQT